MSTELRITRFAVALTRDMGWSGDAFGLTVGVGYAQVRNALLYVGISPEWVESNDELQTSLSDPFPLMKLLGYLHEHNYLDAFLTEMIRTGFSPANWKEFRSHLQPLGLDWDDKTNQVVPTTTRPEAERQLRTELEDRLDEIGPDFVKMLTGAWEAYYSNNPDKYRQTLSSCRELLNQVTNKLCIEKLERKDRIRHILGTSHSTDVVEASANLVNALYSVQSAEEHTSPDQPTALYALVETEHILYFILKTRTTTSN